MIRCSRCRYCNSVCCRLTVNKMTSESLKKILGEKYYSKGYSRFSWWYGQARILNEYGKCEYFEIKKWRNVLSRL